MYNYKLTLEYDGNHAGAGWQKQKTLPSVQQDLEDALSAVTKELVTVCGAGRTDAGVHAYSQVCNVFLKRSYNYKRLILGTNSVNRNKYIAVKDAVVMPANFHARFSPHRKRYLYKIAMDYSLFHRGYAWYVKPSINIEAMKRAITAFVGTYDFSSFRDVQCQAISPEKTICEAYIEHAIEHSIPMLYIYVVAHGFLHHQVRIIVGTLIEIGIIFDGNKRNFLGNKKSDKISVNEDPYDVIKTLIQRRDRGYAGATAPAWGLYLDRIIY